METNKDNNFTRKKKIRQAPLQITYRTRYGTKVETIHYSRISYNLLNIFLNLDKNCRSSKEGLASINFVQACKLSRACS